MTNLQDRIQFAKSLSIEAGELLLEIFNNTENLKSETKEINDIVTEADTTSEKLILGRILQNFPEDLIVSEEENSDKENNFLETNGFAWAIDPLDGTRNFSIGNPNFAVSIGIIDQNKDFHGVIYYPILKKLFIAENGKSYLGDKIINVNKKNSLKEALVAYGDKREKNPNFSGVDILNRLRGKTKIIRVFGASALEKAWVANGQIDVFVCNSSSVFGAVAGIGLIRNAGGVAYNLEGKEWKLGDNGIICGCKELVDLVFKELHSLD